jgi:hypothetical protein
VSETFVDRVEENLAVSAGSDGETASPVTEQLGKHRDWATLPERYTASRAIHRVSEIHEQS